AATAVPPRATNRASSATTIAALGNRILRMLFLSPGLSHELPLSIHSIEAHRLDRSGACGGTSPNAYSPTRGEATASTPPRQCFAGRAEVRQALMRQVQPR